MTQYAFRDGAWIDTWNDDALAEAWGDWDLSSLIVNACGCVSEQVAEAIAMYLLTEQDGLVGLDGTMEMLLVAVLADNLGLTEHDSSLCFVWLTDAGRSWLDLWQAENSVPSPRP